MVTILKGILNLDNYWFKKYIPITLVDVTR